MPLSNNERLGCYAMLRSLWNTKSDFLAPFERMLVSVLKQHKGINITIEAASKETFDIWHIDIPRMPMMHLFSRLSSKKIVTKRHNDRRFIIHKEKIKNKDTVNEIAVVQMADRFESIVNECCRFCLNQVPSIPATTEQIRQELTSFLSQQSTDLALYTNKHGAIGIDVCQSFYRVGLYIKHLASTDNEKLRFLNDIAVGHILSKCLMLDGNPVKSLNGLTIFLDADIIFILLGIDTLERTEDYKRLITELHNLGATLKVFQHNIDEVNLGLDSAIAWINSPDYNPVLASKAARYFTEKNTSITEIELIQSSLIQILSSEFDISVESANYDTSFTPFNHNEETIQQIIHDKYTESANGRSHDADSRSIQRDACSVNQIYRRRCGASSPNLSECKYVLVTTNVTLAKAIKDYEMSSGLSNNCISACITDALIGTLVWLSQPTRIVEESYARLNALARASFIPSEAEIEEFSMQVGEANKRGVISDDECYFLRTAQVSREMLKRISNGIPTKINETTPEDVLKMILEEGKAQARDEIRLEYDDIISNQSKQSHAEIEKQKEARLRDLKELKHEKELRLQRLNEQKEKNSRSIKRTRIIFAIVLASILIFVITMFCKREWFWGVIGGVPVILGIVIMIVGIFLKKRLDYTTVIDSILFLLQKKKSKTLQSCEEEIENLKKELSDIDSKISYLEKSRT